MKKINLVKLAAFNNINELYLAYKKDPLNEETKVPFFDRLGELAFCIAPEFPAKGEKLGNLSDIYITMHEFAMKSHSSDFLSDVIDLICKEFDNHNPGKAA